MFLYPPTTFQSVFPLADQRLPETFVCVLRGSCGGNRRTPLTGESERVLPQPGHSTDVTPEEGYEQHRSDRADVSTAHLDTPDESSDLASRLYPSQAMKLLWLEVQHPAACLQIDRHRVLMLPDQPRAVDLTEASGPTQPEIGLLPSVHGSAYPVEAVSEGHVIAHRDGQVVNFIADRTLERREYLFPTFPECIRPHVAQRGHDVKRHDLLRVERHDALDVLVTN